MPKKRTFKAIILDAGGGGAFVEVPFDVEKEFGSKRPRVKAMIEGIPYRGTLTRMGTERHMLIILKDIRQKIGKNVGEEIKVTVEPDEEPRMVVIPEGLKMAFKVEKDAKITFEKLSYSHQREYVTWINEAKKEETRKSRILKTIEMLKKGTKA